MEWWQKAELYSALQNEVTGFTFLTQEIEGENVVLRGIWPVYGQSELIESYSIKIVLPKDYPIGVPKIYELEGKIPRIPDRHINYDGSACIFSPPERWEKWPIGSGIDTLLDGPVKDYFFSQAYFERTGKWPFGEWAHGDAGVLQYYIDRLKVLSLKELMELVLLSQYSSPSRQWRCPCGSQKRYRDCHWVYMKPLVAALPKDEWDYLAKLLQEIKKLPPKKTPFKS